LKALFINPKDNSFSVINYDGDYQSIYKILDCRTFDAVYPFDNEDTIYVDDEGLLKGANYHWNVITDRGRLITLVGKGLVLGSDAEGESVDCKTTISELAQRINFIGWKTIHDDNRSFDIVSFN
tara:strand:+ start:1945 stop:2316 length:372 start_codon:yes stop_codon:yes gene_type:complete